MAHHWPGNVRELANCMSAAVQFANGSTVEPRHVSAAMEIRDQDDLASFETMMRRRMVKVLMFTGWRLDQAGQLLDEHPATIRRKLRKMDLRREVADILGQDLDAVLREPRSRLARALSRVHWNKRAAGALLGLSPCRVSNLAAKWELAQSSIGQSASDVNEVKQ